MYKMKISNKISEGAYEDEKKWCSPLPHVRLTTKAHTRGTPPYLNTGMDTQDHAMLRLLVTNGDDWQITEELHTP